MSSAMKLCAMYMRSSHEEVVCSTNRELCFSLLNAHASTLVDTVPKLCAAYTDSVQASDAEV